MWKLLVLISFLLSGCIIPAEVFFRNFSNQTVRLHATLADRRLFKKLPNKVSFYDTSTTKRQFYGDWRTNAFVTWVDTTNFYIDIPASTVVNIADVSNGLALGSNQPDVLLLAITDNKIDTLTTGDYSSLAGKFKSNRYHPLGTAIYYYDFR
ncbi:hypothetical protein [Lacibacter sp. H407]|uniref:hypothetical protein n=1 Tax=Lacibacter sp. H407 TaxID=3133423 RepID=UPI0030C137D9